MAIAITTPNNTKKVYRDIDNSSQSNNFSSTKANKTQENLTAIHFDTNLNIEGAPNDSKDDPGNYFLINKDYGKNLQVIKSEDKITAQNEESYKLLDFQKYLLESEQIIKNKNNEGKGTINAKVFDMYEKHFGKLAMLIRKIAKEAGIAMKDGEKTSFYTSDGKKFFIEVAREDPKEDPDQFVYKIYPAGLFGKRKRIELVTGGYKLDENSNKASPETKNEHQTVYLRMYDGRKMFILITSECEKTTCPRSVDYRVRPLYTFGLGKYKTIKTILPEKERQKNT